MSTNNVIDAKGKFSGGTNDQQNDPAYAVTILCTTDNAPLNKAFRPDADGVLKEIPFKKRGYASERATFYHLYKYFVDGLPAFEEILRRAASKPKMCMIRGVRRQAADIPQTYIEDGKTKHNYIPSKHKDDRVKYRKRGQVFKDAPLHHHTLDIEGFDETMILTDWREDPGGHAREVIQEVLPDIYHNAECVYHYSNSHGIKEGTRLHLTFWYENAFTLADLKRYFAARYGSLDAVKDRGIDIALFSACQYIFIANPEFVDGAVSPVKENNRIGRLEGDAVVLEPEDIPEAPRTTSAEEDTFFIPGGMYELPDYKYSFNAVATERLPDILEAFDFEEKSGKWLPPESESGSPGVVIKDGKVFSHNQSGVLPCNTPLDAYQVFTKLRAAQVIDETLNGVTDEFGGTLPNPEMVAERDADNLAAKLWVERLNEEHFILNANRLQQAISFEVATRTVSDISRVGFELKFMNKPLFTSSITKGITKDGGEVCLLNRTKHRTNIYWLKHRDRSEYSDMGIYNDHQTVPDGHFNLWGGFAVEPRKGDWRLFKRYLLEVVCQGDKKHYVWIVNWMAQLLQRPGDQIGTTPVLYGGHGWGKTFFMKILGMLFHSGQVLAIGTPGGASKRFNSFLMGKVLVKLDEQALNSSDNDSRKDAAVLRGLMTEPEISIEIKGGAVFPVKNTLNFAIAADFNGIPAIIAHGERRYQFFKLSDIHEKDHAYFGAIERQMADKGGLEAMLYDLLAYEVDVNMTAEIIKNELYSNIVKASGDSVTKWLHELAADEDAYNTVVEKVTVSEKVIFRSGKDRVFEDYRMWCSENGFNKRETKQTFLQRLYQQKVCKPHEIKQGRNDEQPRRGVKWVSFPSLRKLLSME